MSSGIFIRFQIHPMYASFLQGYYNCYAPVFSFPREDFDQLDLAYEFKRRLKRIPQTYKPEKIAQDDFLIEIPNSKDRPASSFSFMSSINKETFVKTIKIVMHTILRDRINKNRSMGLEIKDSIRDAMDYYGIPQDHFESIRKEYQRWQWRAYKVKKPRKKQEKNIYQHD